MDLKQIMSNVTDAFEENQSSIFIGLGLAAFGTAVILACVESPKAKKVIDKTKEDLVDVNEMYEDEEMTEEDYKEAKKDIYIDCGKELLKRYGPVVLLAASGTACILNAHSIDTGKIAGLTTALQISESTKKLYKEKVIEKIGEKKEREIVDEVHREQVKRTKKPEEKKIPVLETTKPAQLCFDPYTGRYFRCSVDRIKSAINSVNEYMLNNMVQTADLNDFYDNVGLPNVKGEVKGWNIDHGCISFVPSSAVTEDDDSCLVIDFSPEPAYL